MIDEFVTCPCSATDCSTALGKEGKDADSITREEDIMEYLNKCHSVYFDGKMAALEGELAELVGAADGMKVVGRFFTALRDEVAGHFKYEESVTFPHVVALLTEGSNGNSAPACSAEDDRLMEAIKENHSNIMEKLGDLKTLVMKHLPTSCDRKLRNKVLLHVYNLEQDLNRHIQIEDEVLVPLMKILEKHGH